mmetsp:Transcript_8687/g.11291  ORF Transcript_8687/g.11291 Transcript_8687/m.11291 type:complete len:455 (+) Transcript_8687:574-1938(+)
MVEFLYYPEGLLFHSKFDKNFAVRGLVCEKEKGLLFKLDANNRIAKGSVFFARQRLTDEEMVKEFGSRHLSHDYVTRKLKKIPDLFTLAEACLLSDACQYFLENNIPFHPGAVTEDVNMAIRYVHKSETMHKEVMSNMDKYYHPTPYLADMLQQLRKKKKTFLMSNSSFEYINTGMTHLVGSNWLELFDVVVASSQKPNFFTGRTLFRKMTVDREGNSLRYKAKWDTVSKFKPGSAYIKGNVKDFLRFTGWQNSNILYIGDNLSADLVEPARINGWYTGAIIRELENEIKKQGTEEYQVLTIRLQLVEETMRRLQWAEWDRAEGDPEEIRMLPERNTVLLELESERTLIQSKMNNILSPNFGSVFTADNGAATNFASSVHEYVDLYTSRLENFKDYNDDYRFIPRRRGLPHEPRQRIGLATDLLKSALPRADIENSDIGLKHDRDFLLSEISFK